MVATYAQEGCQTINTTAKAMYARNLPKNINHRQEGRVGNTIVRKRQGL